MSLSGVCLATRGFICFCYHEQAVVCDKPRIEAVVEVRPKIRAAAASFIPAIVDSPSILSVKDLKPGIKKISYPSTPVDTTDHPKLLSVVDLRPTIKKVEET